MDGKSMIPPQGNTILYYSSQQPSLPWTLEGLFELTWCPLRALNSPHELLPERESCASLGPKVPGHRKEQLKQTLIVCLLFKTQPFSLTRKAKGDTGPLGPGNCCQTVYLFMTPMIPNLTGMTLPHKMSMASVPASMRSSFVTTASVRRPSGQFKSVH